MEATARKSQAFGQALPFAERKVEEAKASAATEAASKIERESARLAALDRIDILDTPREEAFDRITRLTKRLFDAPIALVSFIDGHRQWYKSCSGLRATE